MRVLLTTAILLGITSASAVAGNRIIARSTDLAPVDGPPVLYGEFSFGLGAAAITDAGDVWFPAQFRDLDGQWRFPDSGIFLSRGGQSHLVLRQNQLLPAPQEGVPLLLMDPDDAGDYLTWWKANSTTLYFYPPSSTPPYSVARPWGHWTAAVNAPPTHQVIEKLLPAELENVNWAGVSHFSESNPLVISVLFDDDPRYLTHGIFTRNAAGEFSLLAREFGPAPGTPPGAVFDVHHLRAADVADDGSVLIAGTIAPNIASAPIGGEDPSFFTGLWKQRPGGPLKVVAMRNLPAPATDRVFHRLAGGEINRQGEVAFAARLFDENATSFLQEPLGVWTDRGGSGLRLVLIAGQAAPGAPDGFSFATDSISSLDISDSGKIAILGSASNGPAFRQGIWEETGTELRLVAFAGDSPPGARAGEVFQYIRLPEMNHAGQIVFEATLDDQPGGVESGEQGIWAQDREGNLRLIVRTGDSLEVAPGRFSIVRGVGFEQNEPQQVINDRGEIVFHAYFTDGTEAIIVSDAVAIPEPAGCIIALGFVAMSLCIRLARSKRRPVACV